MQCTITGSVQGERTKAENGNGQVTALQWIWTCSVWPQKWAQGSVCVCTTRLTKKGSPPGDTCQPHASNLITWSARRHEVFTFLLPPVTTFYTYIGFSLLTFTLNLRCSLNVIAVIDFECSACGMPQGRSGRIVRCAVSDWGRIPVRNPCRRVSGRCPVGRLRLGGRVRSEHS